MLPPFLTFLFASKKTKESDRRHPAPKGRNGKGRSQAHAARTPSHTASPRRRSDRQNPASKPPLLGEILVRDKVISREQLNNALSEQQRMRRPLYEILAARGILDDDNMDEYIQLQIAGREEDGSPLRLPPLPQEVEDFAFLNGAVLNVATGRAAHPRIGSWVNTVRREKRVEIRIRQCDMESLTEQRRYLSTSDVEQRAKLPAIQRVRGLIAEAVKDRASDVKMTLVTNDGSGYMDVHFRINGDMVKRAKQYTEEDGEMMIRSIYTGMADLTQSQFIDADDQPAMVTGAAFLRDSNEMPLPLSALRVQKSKLTLGQGVAIRLLYEQREDGHTDQLGELGYSANQKKTLWHLSRLTNGVCLFTGPTGSGKSTTLARMIQIIKDNRKGVSVITIEDPAEYKFLDTRIWQYYIPSSDDANRNVFAEKLKVSLREDPDIIMVGEIRELSTAEQALNAAITGHQVWTTLHVTEPLQTITRLKAMKVDEYLLRDHRLIRAICGQRLIKQLCPDCSRPLAGHEGQYDPLSLENLETWTKGTPFHNLDQVRVPGHGCESCRGTKYSRSRTVAAQIIQTDAEMLEGLLDHGTNHVEKSFLGKPDAAPSMQAHGILKILAGRTDILSVESVLDPLLPRPESLRVLTLEDL